MPMLDLLPSIDKQDPLPRHAQVQRILRELVTSGRLKPGDKIPAEVDIAQRLGVSKMTVNKALLALTAGGYFIREVGRGTFVAEKEKVPPPLTIPRTPRLVVSFVEGARDVLNSDYYGTLYQGILSVLEPRLAREGGRSPQEEQVHLVLAPAATRDYLSEDGYDPADGRLIVAPRADSIPSIEALWQQGKPVIVLGASWPSMAVPSVDSDNIGGATEAVQYLARLGHRRIALLLAEEETANIQDRIVGYRRGLQRADLPPCAEWEVTAEAAWRAGEPARDQLLALLCHQEPVTAIFAAGHYLALEAKRIVREAGLRIPDDVSIVGYDDPMSAQLVYPALTTVRQPLKEMGQRAAERLLKLIYQQEPRSLVREVLPAQLVIRASTAPPAR